MQTVFIAGLGLIGSSLARAIRQRRGDITVCGYDRDEVSQAWALRRHVIDVAAPDFATGAASADVIILAAPVSAICAQLGDLAHLPLKADVIVTDTGSTKTQVLAAAAPLMARDVTFIGGHPMAGSEKAGVQNGRAGLFAEAHYFLVNGNATPTQVLALRNVLAAAGSYFVELPAAAHDELVGAISHVPHVVAASLAQAAATSVASDPSRLRYAAGGFRDTTRIAASDPDLWTAVMLSNQDVILAQLATFTDKLAAIQHAVAAGDAAAIHDFFAHAQAVRRGLDQDEEADEPWH